MATYTFETLLVETEGATLKITINRPEAMNSLNFKVIDELELAMNQLASDPHLKGAIITGAGTKAFVAGADIAGVNQIPARETEDFSKRGQDVFFKIENSSKPVIAAVNGFALGGGCELAMACHMRVAAENAKFGQPEVNLGLIAGYGGTQRLVQLIGKGKATELLLTGAIVKADEALTLGLANHVVAADALLAKALELLQTIYEKSPLAVALTLEAIQAGVHNPATGYAVEASAFGRAARSADGREGTAAFLEKRKPAFTTLASLCAGACPARGAVPNTEPILAYLPCSTLRTSSAAKRPVSAAPFINPPKSTLTCSPAKSMRPTGLAISPPMPAYWPGRGQM
jgi:enoyl-CoA hydratase